MAGGTGDDRYFVDNIRDKASERPGEGIDRVIASVNFTLGANVEELVQRGADDLRGTGNDLANGIQGNTGSNLLEGKGGDDDIRGDDGNDTIAGGLGIDRLTGGQGFDSFRYALGTEADRDTILDFETGDKIDLSAIRIGTSRTDLPFHWLGSAGFDGVAGGLRVTVAGPGSYDVQGDIDGDGVADFLLTVVNSGGALSSGDFVL